MTDEVRLQLMEGIAGVTVYEEKRSNAIKDLELISEKVEETERKLTTMDERMDELAADQEELKQWQKLERERKTIEYLQADETVKKKRIHLKYTHGCSQIKFESFATNHYLHKTS